MENPQSRPDTTKAASDICAALFDMRDSLVKLSLALKDLQFETDLELRKNAEIAVHQMIQHMTTPRGAPPPS